MNKQLFFVKTETNKFQFIFPPLQNLCSSIRIEFLLLSYIIRFFCRKIHQMKKLIFTLMFVFAMCGLNAQSYELVIKMNDGTETIWNYESLNNICFEDETTLIIVERDNLYTHSYNIAEINKLYFNSSENIFELGENNNSFVFPNPAKDDVRIIGIKNQEIEIISINGKSMLRIFYDGKSLDVSSLPQGLYLIKTNNKTLKFEKI